MYIYCDIEIDQSLGHRTRRGPNVQPPKANQEISGEGPLFLNYNFNSVIFFYPLGFYLTPSTMNWNTGKSTCEGMGMQLASLTSSAINDAAITYINVQQRLTGYQ